MVARTRPYDKLMVVIIMQGRARRADRSWHADNERQAERLVEWLRASGIRVIAAAEAEWRQLPEYCE